MKKAQNFNTRALTRLHGPVVDNKRDCRLPQAECARYTEVHQAGEAPPLPAWTHCASQEAGPGQFLRT